MPDHTDSERTTPLSGDPERTVSLPGGDPHREAPWVGSARVPTPDRPVPPTPDRRVSDTLEMPAVLEPALPAPAVPLPTSRPSDVPPSAGQLPAAPPPGTSGRRSWLRRRRPPAPAPSAPPPGYGYGPPSRYGPPGYGPPGYGPPGYGPPPRQRYRRRRRRWPVSMLTMLFLCAGCCGWLVLAVKPYVDQYPASVAAEPDVDGLVRVSDPARSARARVLLSRIQGFLDEDTFTVLYVDGARRPVTAFGVTRFVASPGKDLDEAFGRLTGNLSIAGRHEVDPGPLGGEERCGTGSTVGTPVVVCGWADHGSLAVVLFAGRSEAEAVELTPALRTALIVRG